MPVRVALTGSTVSPGLYESLELVGRDESLRRHRRRAGRRSPAAADPANLQESARGRARCLSGYVRVTPHLGVGRAPVGRGRRALVSASPRVLATVVGVGAWTLGHEAGSGYSPAAVTQLQARAYATGVAAGAEHGVGAAAARARARARAPAKLRARVRGRLSRRSVGHSLTPPIWVGSPGARGGFSPARATRRAGRGRVARMGVYLLQDLAQWAGATAVLAGMGCLIAALLGRADVGVGAAARRGGIRPRPDDGRPGRRGGVRRRRDVHALLLADRRRLGAGGASWSRPACWRVRSCSSACSGMLHDRHRARAHR